MTISVMVTSSIENLKYDVFIAYAAADQERAIQLYTALTPDLSVFVAAKSLKPGDPWDIILPAAQRNSLVTVVLISESTKYSYYEQEEIVRAINLTRNIQSNHTVIPVILSKRVKLDRLPYGLGRVHFFRAYTPDKLREFTIQLKELIPNKVLRTIYADNSKDEVSSGIPQDKPVREPEQEVSPAAEDAWAIVQKMWRKNKFSLLASHVLVYLDLDGFTGLNRRWGSATGDKVISIVNNIVLESFGEDYNGRWRQDAWIAYLKFRHGYSLTRSEQAAKQLCSRINHYEWDGIGPGLYVSGSVGIARYDGHQTAEEWIIRAMQGAEKAKSRGGNTWCWGPEILPVHFSRKLSDYPYS